MVPLTSLIGLTRVLGLRASRVQPKSHLVIYGVWDSLRTRTARWGF